MKRTRFDDIFSVASTELTQRLSRRKLLGFFGKISAGATFLGLLGRNAAAFFAPNVKSVPQGLPCETDLNFAASGWGLLRLWAGRRLRELHADR